MARKSHGKRMEGEATEEGEADEEDFRLGAVGIRDNSQTSHKSMRGSKKKSSRAAELAKTMV